MKGTVKFFNSKQQYGQITPDEGDGPLIFNLNPIHGPLTGLSKGDRVEFEVEPQSKGRSLAVNVRLLASASSIDAHSGKCFVVMPSGRGMDEKRWFSGWYKMVIEEGVRAAGFEPILAAAQDQPNAINDEIRAHLAFDPMVVVDLGGFTADADPNPNVMYELGLRHALNLPVVLMAWADQHLPFDISNQRVIMERRDLLDVSVNRERLTRFIQEAVAGNYYRPMDAVGRVGTLERAETTLNPSSVLAALVREVRDLKNRVIPHQRFSAANRVKQALGNKANRKALLDRFLLSGGTYEQWSQILRMPVEKVGFRHEGDLLPELLRIAKTVPVQSLAPAPTKPDPQPSQPLSEAFLDQVTALMPIQPWPTGAAASVAETLGVSRSQIGKATQELIRRGVFLKQHEGTLVEETPHGSAERTGSVSSNAATSPDSALPVTT